jgi:hypothetical protein
MGEPQRSDAVESDRRSSPRFPAELLGKASVRLLGGSEVTLINFSERGVLFQSDQRLLVGARGTIRIVVGTETTIAAGTVVRSLVQGMASGKLAFHTALALDQPLALATAVEARERAAALAKAPAPVEPEPEPQPEPAAVEPPPAVIVEPPPPSGKTIEKRSHKNRAEKAAARVDPPPPVEAPVEPPPIDDAPALEFEALEPAAPAGPERIDATPVAAAVPAPPPVPPAATIAPMPSPLAPVSHGFGDSGFDGGGSFGWSDPAANAAPAGLSVLFVSTTKERTARLQGILAGHRRDIVLTAVMHGKAEAIADIARQHDVLLFDFAIGPEALERTLASLRQSPLGASIAVLVPLQTALPSSVAALANACVIETTSGDMLVAALRDAAWTPWQPVDPQGGAEPTRDDLFWKAFDALPVPVFVVDAEGTILHANGACAKLAEGVDLLTRPLASFFVAEDTPAIAALIASGLAGGYDDTPVFTAPADGQTVQVVLQALSVLPGAGGRPELALRCELRAEPLPVEAPGPAGPDYAAELAALTARHDELTRIADAGRSELERVRAELDDARHAVAGAQRERDDLRGRLELAQRERDELRGQVENAQRERDDLRGPLEQARRDLERSREQERVAATKIVELERVVSDAARSEVAAARAQSQLAATTEELAALRNELDGQRMRVATQGVDAERTAAKHAAIEASARQAVEELKAARSDAQRLTRERDQALAAVEAERARADAALTAVRDDAKKSRKIVSDDAVALTAAKLQRQVEELRAELQQEQDARKELEELLDANATNLEQTIQDYEERLEALGAGAEDKRPAKPKKSQRG